jgi:hypothetical protein
VAEAGLDFLQSLSASEANDVCALWCSMGGGQGADMVGGLRALRGVLLCVHVVV